MTGQSLRVKFLWFSDKWKGSRQRNTKIPVEIHCHNLERPKEGRSSRLVWNRLTVSDCPRNQGTHYTVNVMQMSTFFNVSFLFIFHVSAYRQVCVLCTNKMPFRHYICTTRVIRTTCRSSPRQICCQFPSVANEMLFYYLYMTRRTRNTTWKGSPALSTLMRCSQVMYFT